LAQQSQKKRQKSIVLDKNITVSKSSKIHFKAYSGNSSILWLPDQARHDEFKFLQRHHH